MGRVRGFARLGRANVRLAMVVAGLAATAGPARAFSGTMRYEGALGPVTAQRPLCICFFTDPQLSNGIGCGVYGHNDAGYTFQFGNRDYYAIAFLDVHKNDAHDPDEPFEIFRDRGVAPGDPVNGRSARSDVDFTFGDENLPGAPTETPTVAPSATPTGTPTVPSPPAVVGDCDGDGHVSVNELVRGVGIALAAAPLSSCAAADRDGDGQVRIEELVAALAAALDG